MKKFWGFIEDILKTPLRLFAIIFGCILLSIVTLFLPFINLLRGKTSASEIITQWRIENEEGIDKARYNRLCRDKRKLN